MDISALSLWLVCGLGAPVFTALRPVPTRALLGAVAAYVFGAWWIHQAFAPSASLVAVAAALTALAYLVRSPGPGLAAAAAGLLAGMWAGVIEFQGVPIIAAVAFSIGIPLLSSWLRGSRAVYAPPRLREEALLFIVVLGVIAGAAPTVVDGWHAAANLNLQGREPQTQVAVIPSWSLVITAGALLTGAAHSLWRRR